MTVSFALTFFFLDQNLAKENQLINILDGKHCLLILLLVRFFWCNKNDGNTKREYKVDTEDGKKRDEEIESEKVGTRKVAKTETQRGSLGEGGYKGGVQKDTDWGAFRRVWLGHQIPWKGAPTLQRAPKQCYCRNVKTPSTPRSLTCLSK